MNSFRRAQLSFARLRGRGGWLGVLFVGVLPGCEETGVVAPGWEGNGWLSPQGEESSCTPSTERRCTRTVDQENGFHTCFVGQQTCDDSGHFGPCLMKRSYQLPAAPRSGVKTAAISGAPISCSSPCDPSCQHWAEPGDLSGSLDLSLPDFPGTVGGPACAHELCRTGAALDATCDPCATQVCAVDASCCVGGGGSWDELCVDLVYEVCLAEPRPLSLCDFGLYSASTNQVTINDLQTTSDITVGGLGNITVSGSSGRNVRKVVTQGPVYMSSPFLPEDGIVALGDITLQPAVSNATVGPLESGANVNLYGDPVVDGDVLAQGNIVWETTIYGDALAGGSVNLDGGCAGSVSGSCTNGSMHAAPSLGLPVLPAQTFACGGANTNVGGGNLTLTPGNYGDVYVGGELTLSGAGTYNFNRVYAHDIRLDGDGGRIDVQVCNEFNVLTGGRVLDATGSLLTDPSLLFVNVQGNLHFDSDVDWVGVVLAGSSGTKTGGSIHGAIWASPVNDIVSQTSIVGIPREDCLALEIPGTTPAACPIANELPSVPAALVEPCGSGLDCQINHRCEAPTTAVECVHSKCGEGSALAATCDDCVAAICAVDADCCLIEWDASCVNKVASVCDAVCATDGGSCNAAICSDEPNGSSICDFGVSAAGSVYVSAASGISPRPEVSGSVGAAGALTLNWSDIGGNVWVGGALSSFASTYGTVTSVAPAVFSSRTVSCPATDGAPSSGAIGPGNYGAVVVPAGQTLTLMPGDYTFSSLVLADQSGPLISTLEVPSSGEVHIEVCTSPTSVVFGAGSRVSGLTPSTALQLDLYAAGGIVATSSEVYGFLQSATELRLTDTSHVGLLSSGNTVNIIGSSSVESDGLRQACLLGGYDPTQDPDVLSAPTETGSCVHNEEGYQDPTCSTYDLALDVPCEDQVTVCNHGTGDFSGSVTVAYFDDMSPVMSNLSPPAPTGTCTGVISIPAGACESITCDSLPSETLTMVLDPDNLLDECGSEERRWDDWTVHDGRSCAGPSSHEFDYVATCPDPGAVPMWGLLTYSATIPGTSTIEFLARTGAGSSDEEAAADAADSPYVSILTADNTLEECSIDGMLPCPVDLTDVLDLGRYQGHHLDLQIVLHADASGLPHLSEWDITYSCVVDQ